jgi:hypothetical protein
MISLIVFQKIKGYPLKMLLKEEQTFAQKREFS